MIAPVTFATLALAVAPSMANYASFGNRDNVLRHRHVRRRLDTLLLKRKVLGWGDATSKPANVATGSDDASCTCWHEVAAGEVCLGLIDKSSVGFTLDKFFKLNPSLNNDCGNLRQGLSYCVDDGANTSPAGTASSQKTASAVPVAALKASPVIAAAKPSASCQAVEDDDDEGEDEDDDVKSPLSTAAVATKTNAAVAQAQLYQDGSWTPSSGGGGRQRATRTQQAQQQQPQATTTSVAAPAAEPQPQSTYTPEQQQQQQQQQQETLATSTVPAVQTTQAPADSSGTGIGAVNTGTSTWYEQKGQAGSCGIVSSDDDFVAAIFTGAEYGKSDCGRMAKVVNTANGKSVNVKILDTCPTCSGQTHIDLSVAAFLQLGELATGVLQTTWQFTS